MALACNNGAQASTTGARPPATPGAAGKGSGTSQNTTQLLFISDAACAVRKGLKINATTCTSGKKKYRENCMWKTSERYCVMEWA